MVSFGKLHGAAPASRLPLRRLLRHRRPPWRREDGSPEDRLLSGELSLLSRWSPSGAEQSGSGSGARTWTAPGECKTIASDNTVGPPGSARCRRTEPRETSQRELRGVSWDRAAAAAVGWFKGKEKRRRTRAEAAGSRPWGALLLEPSSRIGPWSRGAGSRGDERTRTYDPGMIPEQSGGLRGSGAEDAVSARTMGSFGKSFAFLKKGDVRAMVVVLEGQVAAGKFGEPGGA